MRVEDFLEFVQWWLIMMGVYIFLWLIAGKKYPDSYTNLTAFLIINALTIMHFYY